MNFDMLNVIVWRLTIQVYRSVASIHRLHAPYKYFWIKNLFWEHLLATATAVLVQQLCH